MAVRDLIVRILGDDKSLQSALLRDTKAVDRFGNTSKSGLKKFDDAFTRSQKIAAGGFVGGAAATAAIAAIKTSTNAASDLNEQVTKNQQVFGDSAKAVQAWSSTTAKALGISQTAALEATGTFGNLFRAIGVGGPQAADTSKRLTQLASDLASFNNADPSQVLDAIRSGLIGEAEPLRKFGVLLSEARVQQIAMAQTGKTSAQSLTDQEKALARVSIIFKDTSAAQGDFARTSEGLANQQRILSAEVQDLQSNMGNLLLPVVKNVTSGLVDASQSALDLTSALQSLGQVKIPSIHIPLVADFGGGTIGGAVSKFGGEVIKTAVKVQFLGIGGAVASTIIDAFGDGVDQGLSRGTPELAAQFEDSLNGMFKNAMATAAGNIKPQQLTPAIKFDQLPGVKTAADDIGKNIMAVFESAQSQVAEAIDKTKSAIKADKAAKAQDEAQAAAAEAARKRSERFAKILATLQLGVDRSLLTKTLSDDLNPLEVLKAGLEKQIRSGVDVQSAQAQLVQVTGQIAAKQEEIQKSLADALQARQFRALGLNAQGDKPPPAIANLKKQLEGLINSDEITPKIRGQLERVGLVLSGQFGKVTEDTRAAIKGLFETIRGTLNKEIGKTEQQPLKRIQLSDKILEALGLGKEPTVAKFNVSALASMAGAPRLHPVATASTATGGVNINGPITVVADNPDAFLRDLQKKAGRTSATSRGRFPGRSLGLG